MKQITNPYLPSWEYVPDGEPHVFGDRLYLYGSHDRYGGKKFCMNDYVCYSASVSDLTDWRYEGVIYTRTQDYRMVDGIHELWAPDVVQGKDGRYYLYYCPDDKIRSIGVAVSDSPAGKYNFLGVVKDRKGSILGERPGDTIQFDPGIFIDDDGEIYLYSGNGARTERDIGKEPQASVVMTLEDDMVTIKTEPKKLLPTLGGEKGTGFEGHTFFEASSIRKINGKYYLVYSSNSCHELCYAVSDRPDGGFRYGGVVISNCDLFPDDPGSEPMIPCGNNHGGIENVNGRWYVFYHRPTNRSVFSRQGWAEEIHFLPDGSIPQVEMTSQGLNGGPLSGKGVYPAAMACHLRGKSCPQFAHPLSMGKRHPYVIQNGPDYDPETDRKEEKKPPIQYITNMKNGSMAGYRYFAFQNLTEISVCIRGKGHGRLLIKTGPKEPPIGEIQITPAKEWTKFIGHVASLNGKHGLYFCYEGRGNFEFLKFGLS